MFQSTPPRGGRRLCSLRRPRTQARFNPRPRAGGDQYVFCDVDGIQVSIHAPARGATRDGRSHFQPRQFQSTPPRGGRHAAGLAAGVSNALFQSTPPRGGRPAARALLADLDVSIHAPARGATHQVAQDVKNIRSFNPRPRAGGDRQYVTRSSQKSGFNPRPRAGGDSPAHAI